jgi:uncharacterized membrane protein YdbT with pleckstrin-like domain
MIQIYRPLPGEEERLVLRRFPKFAFLILLKFFFRVLIPFAFLLVFVGYFDIIGFGDASYVIMFALFFAYLSLLLLFTYIEWSNEELDILLVTNKRVIIFLQRTFFYRDSSITSLSQVQDVQGKTQGFINSFLNIGTIEIQTAADKIQFIMDDIRYPEKVVSEINSLVFDYNRTLQKKEIELSPELEEKIYENTYLNELLKETRGRLLPFFRK